MPNMSLELWQLLLNSGVGSLALVLLIIFIPFLCGIFWLILRQQGALAASLVSAIVGSMGGISEELRGVNHRLDEQTKILTEDRADLLRRQSLVKLIKQSTNDRLGAS